MRHEKIENLLRLALDMQGTREGLSLGDIQERLSISRRTAERMRDSVERVFPQMQQANPGERPKRWRIPSGVLNSLVVFTADELAALTSSINILERENLLHQAELLRDLETKVRSLMDPSAIPSVDVDLEVLLEAEGLAMRPGPRPIVLGSTLVSLRTAIKACAKVDLHYHSRSSGKTSHQTVCPYGFLYGNRHYLVAYSTGSRDYRLYSLSDIRGVDVLKSSYVRREFSLREYAEQSFGLFHEEPFNVEWKFSPEVTDDAKEFVFHPTQTMEELDDGSLVVRFRAGGALEMAWHLYTWGTDVEVLEPAHLRKWVSSVQAVLIQLEKI